MVNPPNGGRGQTIYNYDRRTAGILKPPPKLLGDLRSALYSVVCGQVWYTQEQILRTQDISNESRVSALRLVQFCKRYTTKPKQYKRSTKVKVPVNLDGWGYLGPEEKVLAQSSLPTVTLEVDFKGSMLKPGFWQPDKALLRITFSSNIHELEDLRVILDHLGMVLTHETRHVAQTIMEYAGKGKNLISPELRNPDPDAEWVLRDVEMQPFVGDAIRDLRGMLWNASPEDRQSLVGMYVGEIPLKRDLSNLGGGLNASPIRKLRKLDIKKWQYAVREIYKGVSDLL